MTPDRPSWTAQAVGASVITAAHDPTLQDLVPPAAVRETIRYFHALNGWSEAVVELFDQLPTRLMDRVASWTASGWVAHPVLRKRWIEDTVRASLDECTQVIVLGAGFDTLASRLHADVPTIRCWEIDHPSTLRVKRRAFASEDSPTLLAVDLTDDTLGTVLQDQAEYDPTAPTVVIAEGLLMYLAAADIDRLFDAVRTHTGPGSRLIGSLLNPAALSPFEASATQVMQWLFGERMLRWLSEPIRWEIEPARLSEILEKHGLELTTIANMHDIRAQYLSDSADVQLYPAEHLFVASMRT